MSDTKASACNKDEITGASGSNPLSESTTYCVDNRKFIVEPRFKESGTKTLVSVLMALIESDCTKH